METVGSYLKKERESKNISLHELSRLTKISELYLKYIEKDEFEKLPQGPYIKGYIASYSRLIGGNVDEAFTLYEALNRKRIEPSPQQAAGNLHRKDKNLFSVRSLTPPQATGKALAITVQTEDIQPDISTHDGGNGLPEKLKTKDRKKPNGSRFGKVKSLFKTAVSSVPINSFSFKAAGTSIKNIGSSIRINRNRFDIVVSFFKNIALSWSWLYAFIALIGIGILALAGFGFYHLFIYDPSPLPVGQLQHVQDKEKLPLPAIGSEKPLFPSESTNASSTADQLDGDANNKQHPEPTSPLEAKKMATPSSAEPDAAIPRIKLGPENSTGTSNPAIQTGIPLSGSSLTAENADSSQITAGTESQVRSGQSELTAGASPEPTTADAELNVLQATVCAEIKNRMPAGVDTSFPTSAQRVFVWSEIEAQQVPSKIRHIYYFNGQNISDVTLDVRSTNWRTWSFKNISDSRYRGEWRVDIATTDGKVLRRLYFEVR